MGYIGTKPSAVPLTSADITDGIITSAKIADGTIVNADINASAAIASTKLSGSLGSFVFLGETTASNVATVDLNGYFTSDYDIYKIFIDGLYGSVNDKRVHMQFSTGSYTVQTSNYYSANAAAYQNSGTQDVYGEGVYNGSYAIICEYTSSTSTQQSNIELTLYNPLTTSYVKSYTNAFRGTIGNITGTRSGAGGGSWNDTTAATGVRFLMESGNIYARKIKIYGIKNS